MKENRRLVLRVAIQREGNKFCPRCGIVVPPDTKYIPSPTHDGVHYHPSCLYQVAQQLGCRLAWA